MTSDFYEDDEDAAKVHAAFETGTKNVTAAPPTIERTFPGSSAGTPKGDPERLSTISGDLSHHSATEDHNIVWDNEHGWVCGNCSVSSAGTPTPDLEARIEAAAKAYRRHVLGGHNSMSEWTDYAEPVRAAFAAAGVPALIAEVERLTAQNERLQLIHGAHSTEAYLIWREEVERLRAQRQAALDLCDRGYTELAEHPYRAVWVADVRAALGATE